MTTNDAIPGFEARLALHRIDDRVRAVVAEFWPVFAPHLEEAIDELVDAMTHLPTVGSIINAASIVRGHRDAIKTIEVDHFKIVLSGDLDRRYAESCRRSVQQETAIGLDARIRCTAGSFVLTRALGVLERRRFLSSRKLLQTVRAVSRVINFDIANAMTLHREAATRAASARRNAVDEAINEFSTALVDVLKAIDQASVSLTSTCERIKSGADSTLNRMTSASSASSDASQRVKATAAASEELSASILEISDQASRGLTMAKTAVQDAERAQHTIRSLNETAERIGAVVDAISAVASQTNLLALNATIEAARAGEAGRGFAVVAAEVKALANQTSHATSDISLQIAAIQAATKGSMAEIELDFARDRRFVRRLDQHRVGGAAARHDHPRNRRKRSQRRRPYGQGVQRDQLDQRSHGAKRGGHRRDHRLDRAALDQRQRSGSQGRRLFQQRQDDVGLQRLGPQKGGSGPIGLPPRRFRNPATAPPR